MIDSKDLSASQRYVLSSVTVEIINGFYKIENYAEQYIFIKQSFDKIKEALENTSDKDDIDTISKKFLEVL